MARTKKTAAAPATVDVATQPAAPSPAANGKASKCPLSRADFRRAAPAAIPVSIDGQPVVGERKEFSTGSLGWNVNGKITLIIDGQPVRCQVGMNVTIVGSKDLPPG